jgi:hypothetical protein
MITKTYHVFIPDANIDKNDLLRALQNFCTTVVVGKNFPIGKPAYITAVAVFRHSYRCNVLTKLIRKALGVFVGEHDRDDAKWCYTGVIRVSKCFKEDLWIRCVTEKDEFPLYFGVLTGRFHPNWHRAREAREALEELEFIRQKS